MKEIKWTLQSFAELDTSTLYKFLQARCEVFIVEQHCNYFDPDGNDEVSLHLAGWAEGELAAYARLIPPGIVYEEASIGRVLTRQPFRRTGLGLPLMERAIRYTCERFGVSSIHISAQYYLFDFYQSLGFKPVGEQYLEDEIPHIGMIYSQ